MEKSWDEWMLSITMTHREGMNGSVNCNCDVNQDMFERYRYEKQPLLGTVWCAQLQRIMKSIYAPDSRWSTAYW
jgi:hypothetical protein